jgi:hypothetical protein
MRQVICIRWGEKYGPDYVNRLFGMVARHLDGPFRFVCFTDDATGLREGVEPAPLPPLDTELPTGTYGIWGKSRLWNARLLNREGGDIRGPVLYLDLDVVIRGDLAPFLDHGAPGDVILARNPNTPLEKLGQTSIYRMPVGRLAPLRERFLADPQGTADRYRFEQRFVSRHAPGGVSFWPKGWVAVYKWHCIPTFPLNYLLAPREPSARVVLFPGPLNPPDAVAGRWRAELSTKGPLDHLRALTDGRRVETRREHLRHFVWPAPWVAQHWRE